MSAADMTAKADITPAETRDTPATLLVSELYPSIQGESTHAGRPCGFIRLTGCPLRCRWCDTEYAFTGGRRMSLDEILAQAAGWGVGLVEVTGGEPLAQPECPELLRRLCDAGYDVLLETSGAIDISSVDPRVAKIIDVKCPGSGEERANLWENFARLGPRDEIKFVLAGRGDYEYALRQIAERGLAEGGRELLFSPVHGELDPAELARWILEDRAPARMQVQLHKIIWPAAARGV